MICPYAVNRKTVTAWECTFDDEGRQDSSKQIENNVVTYPECQKENCGAWHNGECGYYLNRGGR